jgi:hypothetical protein
MADSFWGKLANLWKPTENEPIMSDFAGDWLTTFGPMSLTPTGSKVQGVYRMANVEGFLEGTIKDGTLHFRYREPNAGGEGWFVARRYGKFSGQWRQDGQKQWLPWHGERGFEGLWKSSFGPLRLIHETDHVRGSYEGLGKSTIEGHLEGGRLVFRYQEPRAKGEGWFELAPDGLAFQGQWRPENSASWAPWVGERIFPVRGRIWLVVLEAYWQRGLGEKEYAFGNMLREFFARLPNVEVRQRFFNNEAGLANWCRDLVYLAEPVALVLASHGGAEGLTAHGEIIGPGQLVETLRDADNIQLLHFSSCLMMDKGPAGDFARVLGQEVPFPISGYSTSVDWAASALIEFMYLDMILARGLPPQAAADQVMRLVAFAGDHQIADSPYPPAQFRFWQP